MTIRLHVLMSMLRLETAASNWFERMGAKEQDAYLRAHPASHMHGSKGRAILSKYLRPGSDGERDAAAHHLNKMGVPLPEEPAASPSSRFQRETINVRSRRPQPQPKAKTGAKKSTEKVPSGGSAQETSEALQRHFKAGPADDIRGVGILSHRIKESDMAKLHAHLVANGWSHDERDVQSGHKKMTMHEYDHPNGGHMRHVHLHGSSTMSGRDQHSVHTYASGSAE